MNFPRNISSRWNPWIIPVIFIIAASLRLISLDADPPSTAGLHFISDEGWWVHNARNKVLFDNWIMDEFNQSLLASPTFCIATFGAYNLLGVNYGSSRVIPVLSGLITILLFSGLLYAHSPPSTALLATLLFSFNFAFTTMNRTAYVDSTALMFLVLAWWLIDRLPHRVWAVFLSGMSFALAIITKSYLLSVLPPVAGVLFLRFRSRQNSFARSFVMLNTVLFAGGVFAVYMLWKKYLSIPFADDYRLMYSLWQDGNFPGSLREAIRNLPSFLIGRQGQNLIPARFFALNATLLILAGYRLRQLSVGDSIKDAWKKMPRPDKESLIFLSILCMQIAPLTAKPFRRYLLLYIPLVILASRTILPNESNSFVISRSKLINFIRILIPVAVSIILIAPFLTGLFPDRFVSSSKLSALLVAALIVAVLTLMASAFLFRKSHPLSWVAVLGLFIFIDGGLHLHGILTRSFTLRDTSRRLGQDYFKPSSVILGGIAHSLCLETQARPIALWGREEAARVLNQDPIRRFEPDYLIVLKKLDGLEWVREKRYESYVFEENFIETLYLLPCGDQFRVEADLYRAPESEPNSRSNPRILVSSPQAFI